MTEGVEQKRQRLLALSNPARFTQLLNSLSRPAEEYLQEAAEFRRPVLRWESPENAVARFQTLLEEGSSDLEVLARTYLAHATQLQSPRNLGHQVAVPILEAAALESLSALTNQGSALFELSPASNGIEKSIIRRLCSRVGWTDGDGIGTHGGTLANLTALLAARNRAFPDAWETGTGGQGIVLTSADAHYSMSRAMGILGMGTKNLEKIPVDRLRKWDVPALRSRLKKAEKPVIAVVASLCSTSVGSFDPLEEVAALCREKNIWLHVDGAHGAAVLFSKRHRALFAGIELADSLTWDAHKLLSIPGVVTFLLYREKSQSYLAFRQDAPYLFNKQEEQIADFNAGLRTVECTRRSIALSLWGVWSRYGDRLFEDIVDVTFETTRNFYNLLKETPDFEPYHSPESNILCFRHKASSARQEEIRRRVVERGNFYISRTKLDGEVWLRVTIMNPATEVTHLKELLDEIRAVAAIINATHGIA